MPRAFPDAAAIPLAALTSVKVPSQLLRNMFRNNCDGTFTDVSAASGIAAAPGKGLGIAFGDYNADGWPDLYVANDSAPQMLFRNNGDGTFTDVALAAGVAYTADGKVFSGMGAIFADLDNRGLPDILATALP